MAIKLHVIACGSAMHVKGMSRDRNLPLFFPLPLSFALNKRLLRARVFFSSCTANYDSLIHQIRRVTVIHTPRRCMCLPMDYFSSYNVTQLTRPTIVARITKRCKKKKKKYSTLVTHTVRQSLPSFPCISFFDTDITFSLRQLSIIGPCICITRTLIIGICECVAKCIRSINWWINL